MKSEILKLFAVMGLLLSAQIIFAQNAPNWTSKQLMEPSDLAMILKSKKAIPVIFSVGPAATIPYSTEIGMVKDKENLDKFKKKLGSIPVQTRVVVYCGCCPFEHCPNIRPAIDVLKEMKFTNYMLLNLPHNIKTDWLDKEYPTSGF